MLWYRFFEPHILDRGEAYYQDGCATAFRLTETGIDAQVEGEYLYHISIELDGGHVKDMSCDCPYARSGENCKHMAAVLFQYEEMLAEEDLASDSEEADDTDNDDEMYASDSDEVAELVSRIPEEECRNILIDYVRQDVSLFHKLQIQYTDKLNKRQKLALKQEIDHIVRNNSYRGYVDWRQADQFVSELTDFLDEKVRQLIQHNELEFAFELTNEVFHCIGTMDMDDSYGGSSDVASQCYEYWRLILERSDETLKNRMKKWFRMHQHGYVLDVYEDYLEEFLMSELMPEEFLSEKIWEFDQLLQQDPETHTSPTIYSAHGGYENVILLRIAYMKKLGCTEKDVQEFLIKNRRFYTVRELEINEALESGDNEKAISLLQESKRLDVQYSVQVRKYSEQLAELYAQSGDREKRKTELLYLLCHFRPSDLTLYKALKREVTQHKEWERLVESILSADQKASFVCMVLNEEKRYEDLVEYIKKENSIDLWDRYEKLLVKHFPEEAIEFYAKYVVDQADRAYDRNGYRYLMAYLRKIQRCTGGAETAMSIAKTWRSEYKRKWAMMEELTNAGF